VENKGKEGKGNEEKDEKGGKSEKWKIT